MCFNKLDYQYSSQCLRKWNKEEKEYFHVNLTQNKKPKLNWKQNIGAEKMLSCYEHLLLSWRNWVRFPVPTWWLKTICNSSCNCSNVPLWLRWTSGIYLVNIHTCKQKKKNHTYQIKIGDLKKWSQINFPLYMKIHRLKCVRMQRPGVVIRL